MLGFLARVLGMVTVTEKNQHIEVTGVPAFVIARHINRTYETTRITTNMFVRLWDNGFVIPSFFAVEVHYIFKQALAEAKTWGMRHALERVIAELEKNTWLASTIGPKKSMVDLGYLRELKWKAQPHQIEFLKTYGDMVPRYNLRGYFLASPPGTGKALTLDTPIKIPGGWTTMGQLKVGDIVTSADGTATTVTAVYPQGVTDVYRVTFSDGRTVDTCGQHLWKTYYKDGLKQWDIRDTLEIKRLLSLKTPRVYIPLIESEEGDHKELPLDPWLMGYLLGNGGFSQSWISVSTTDEYIVNEITRLLPSHLKLSHRSKGDYVIVSKDGKSNHLPDLFRRLGLLGCVADTKFLPPEYLNGSHAQRKAVLQGLMDSDGTAEKCGSTSYTSTSLNLAESAVTLVRSLGGIARIRPRKTKYSYKGGIREGKTSYQVNIRHRTPTDLFRLPRKRCRVKDDNQYAPSLKLEVVSVEKIESAPTQCISVDHPDRLYVAGDYVVTHNTFMDLALATCVIPRDLAEVVIIISPKPALKVVWEDTVRQLFHRPPKYWVSSTPGPAPVDRKTRYFIFHNESLDRAEKLAKELSTRNIKFFVIIDESHNFNEQSSNRTQRLENVLAGNRYKPYCVWASGSPIKQSALEAIPFLRSCDPYFTPDVEKRYRAIFSSNAVRAQEVVAHRLGIITFKVSKEVVMKNARPTIIRRAIKLPSTLAKPFLLDTIRDEIRAYIDVRMNYYMSKLKEYDALFDSIVAVHAKTVPQTADAQMKLKRYKEIIRELRRRRDDRKRAEPWMLGYTKQYESTILLPSLPNSLKRQFRECRTIVKSTKLKVIGEALGKVLIPRRAECSLILAKNCRLDEIIRDSLSKTLVFSSSVKVTLDTNDYLIKLGFSPEVVYQKTNAQLPQIIDRFAKNPLINPVCATFQSLSTAVPMIMASTLVMLNLPFRQYIYDQTVSRVYRLGQPYQVTIYEILLDTGSDSNVSSRAADILSFCREHLDVLMGGEFSGPEDDDVILERVLKTT